MHRHDLLGQFEEERRLVHSLNQAKLGEKSCGYGFGTYCFVDGFVQFHAFLPNTA